MTKKQSLHRQFANFVREYAPTESRVTKRNISRFPGSNIGDIANNRLGVSFGYWVNPLRYMRHMKLILDSLHLQPNSRIVTLGIDGGLFEIFLARHVLGSGGRITAFVTDSRNLKIAQRIAQEQGVSDKVTFGVFNIEKMGKIKGASFDAALSIATIHTVPGHLNVVSEFRRLLKPMGRALITYSVPYMRTKLGTNPNAFLRNVRTHFSILQKGAALTPKSSLTIYGEREKQLRRKRGFGISQRYLKLVPRH